MANSHPTGVVAARTKPTNPNWKGVPGKDTHNLQWRLAAGGRTVYRVGYRDADGKQRWRVPGHPPTFDTISEARRARDTVLGSRGRGERVQADARLRFGVAADKWLAGPVATLRENTRNGYRSSVEVHLRPRFGRRRLDEITADDWADLVSGMRRAGYAESTIGGVVRAASQIYDYAARRLKWVGVITVNMLSGGERPKVSLAAEPRIYEGAELAQVLAASHEPWTTLFRLASVIGGRESELLGLWWKNLDLSDLDAATITFTHQVSRKGACVPLKTDESKATLPLPRTTAVMLLEHRARSVRSGPGAFVFSTSSGRPLGQRNVLRALYRAQRDARDDDGQPTFPELFEVDEHGHLAVDAKGRYIPSGIARKDLPPLPDFHALRHTAAMDCDDAEEACDLLRHKNSNVTRMIYRNHFGDRQREALRAKLEARHGGRDLEAHSEAANRSRPQDVGEDDPANVLALRAVGTEGR